jgi:hypothetical protein
MENGARSLNGAKDRRLAGWPSSRWQLRQKETILSAAAALRQNFSRLADSTSNFRV